MIFFLTFAYVVWCWWHGIDIDVNIVAPLLIIGVVARILKLKLRLGRISFDV